MKLNDLPRFYAPDGCENAEVHLPKDEAHHLHVLRKIKGDRVHLMDGKGKLFDAEVVQAKQGILEVKTQIQSQAMGLSRTLLVAPTKNMTRFEWVIEKATEVGITRIIPILSERSERVNLKEERLIRIALSAAKQSKDLYIPIIDPITLLKEALMTDAEHRWIAHCAGGEKDELPSVAQAKGSQLIVIGPEGDFSFTEIDEALSLGYRALSLGEKRLRTETAAVASALAMTLFIP